jgi:hypothetical protein
MSLLTGPPASIGGCQSALADKLGVSLSQYHHTTVHIANHPGMNNGPVEVAVQRRQSHPIIANLPINGEPQWNDTDREKRRTEKNLSQCQFVQH